MQHVILVVSADADLLHQIGSHLEESGRYQVTGAASAHEALNLANNNFFEVAILDGELDDIPLNTFSRDLAALQSELKILVFPPDNNQQHPSLEGVLVNGFLSKPFSGQEFGNKLAEIFSDRSMGGKMTNNKVDELVNQWLQIPEMGSQKAEQILNSTSAQTVMIIVKDELAASAGSVNDEIVASIKDFTARYWKKNTDSELARYLKIDGGEREVFLYTTLLVSEAVLALLYPPTTTIQHIRRELKLVKTELQTQYPTADELKQDIATQALADIHERNKTLEAMQPFTAAISQSELDALALLQGLKKPSTNVQALTEQELTNLDEVISEMPSPDPLDEAEPIIPAQAQTGEQKQPEWISELELADQAAHSPEIEPASTPPAAEPEPEAITPIAEAVAPEISKADELFPVGPDSELEKSPELPVDIKSLPEIDFKLPWETDETEDVLPLGNEPVNTEDSVSTPVSNVTENSVSFAEVVESAILADHLESKVEEDQPSTEIPVVEDEPIAPSPSTEVPALLDPSGSVVEETQGDLEKSTEAIESSQPLKTVGETISAIQESEEEFPPTVKDFRFNYTCVLIPADHNQFLARDLAEKLSLSMPQFHLAQGWKMTSITIRPQYLLWTVAVPMGVCPHQIIHDIRSLTSANLFANFPEIARNKASDDFWSSNFMAVSGNEPPPVNLITNFVANAWKNQEPVAS